MLDNTDMGRGNARPKYSLLVYTKTVDSVFRAL